MMTWKKTADGYEAAGQHGPYEARRTKRGTFILWLDGADEYGAATTLRDCKDRAEALDEERVEKYKKARQEGQERGEKILADKWAAEAPRTVASVGNVHLRGTGRCSRCQFTRGHGSAQDRPLTRDTACVLCPGWLPRWSDEVLAEKRAAESARLAATVAPGGAGDRNAYLLREVQRSAYGRPSVSGMAGRTVRKEKAPLKPVKAAEAPTKRPDPLFKLGDKVTYAGDTGRVYEVTQLPHPELNSGMYRMKDADGGVYTSAESFLSPALAKAPVSAALVPPAPPAEKRGRLLTWCEKTGRGFMMVAEPDGKGGEWRDIYVLRRTYANGFSWMKLELPLLGVFLQDPYLVTLFRRKEEWAASCNCPAGSAKKECKHAKITVAARKRGDL